MTKLPSPQSKAPLGRIPVLEVGPVVEDGRWPAKAVVGEPVPVRATVFREGHDAVAATAVLIDPDGRRHAERRMVEIAPGLDRYEARLAPDRTGDWGLLVEGWSDPFATWAHDATVKVEAGVDVDLMLREGTRLFERILRETSRPTDEEQTLRDALAALRDATRPPQARLAAALGAAVRATLDRVPLRDHVSPSATSPLRVDRTLALASAWYEIFPRSEGAYQDETGRWRSGTLRTATERLPGIAAMGFDIVYLTPIHPIGTTHRKGRNNTLTAAPSDPGSPYAIGSAEGGHDAIHPDLGSFEDFELFVSTARRLGLEVALDVALQCSPDHPWVTEHPEWFTTRADGTIAYAENPPKKYQDIYPLDFDNDPEGLYAEILRILELWVGHGVTAFRVDNPHTKPVRFWERLLADMHARHPDVIFLAEAFTKPAMMHALAKVGFHQSYTYFTWRNDKAELAEYLEEVSGPAGSYMRPNFWPTTHDILTPYVQHGGIAGSAVRAVLAATSSPSWGVYTGYELAELTPRPGAEEHIDNEKYEYKPRDWSAAEGIGLSRLITSLNEVRRAHPSLRHLRNLTVHPTSSDQVLAYSSHLPAEHSPTGEADTVITVVNLDPHHAQEATVHLDLAALGVEDRVPRVFTAYDVLSGESYVWDAHPYVRLDPYVQVAHVIHVRPL